MYDVLHLHCLPGAILLSCMMSYTFIAYLAFWCPVLSEINDVQIFLQTPGLGLNSCVTKLGALVLFCEEERENVVEEAKAKDTTFCEEMGVPTETRLRRGRRMEGENAEDAGLSLHADVMREQLQIIDRLHGEIRNRTNHMMDVNDKFGFLTNMERLMDSASDEGIDSAIDRPTPTSTSPLKG